MYSQIYNPKHEQKPNVRTFPNHRAIEKMQKLSAMTSPIDNRKCEHPNDGADFDHTLILLIVIMLTDIEAFSILPLIPLLIL